MPCSTTLQQMHIAAMESTEPESAFSVCIGRCGKTTKGWRNGKRRNILGKIRSTGHGGCEISSRKQKGTDWSME